MRMLITAVTVLAVAHVAQSNGIAQADILVDFGEPETVLGMPNFTYDPTPSPDPFLGKYWINGAMAGDGEPNTVTVFNDLVDSAGNVLTGTSMSVTGFSTDSGYEEGAERPCNGVDAEVIYPRTAQRDYVGCKYALDPNDANATVGIVTFSGLTEPEYTIKIFGSLWSDPDKSWYNDDNRRNLHTVGNVSKVLHCFDNTSDTVSFYNIAPVNGEITILTTGAEPGGDWTYSYGYLSAMELIIPEPTTLALLAAGVFGVTRRRR